MVPFSLEGVTEGSAGVEVPGDLARGETPLILLVRAMWSSSVDWNLPGAKRLIRTEVRKISSSHIRIREVKNISRL